MIRILVVATVAAFASGCILLDNAPPPGRSFAMSWKLVDARDPDPLVAPSLSCADAGVATILLDALDKDGGQRHRVELTCGTLEGQTPALPQSRYDILLIARASDGTPRSQVRFDADNFDDVAADLGLTIFQINR